MAQSVAVSRFSQSFKAKAQYAHRNTGTHQLSLIEIVLSIYFPLRIRQMGGRSSFSTEKVCPSTTVR